MHDEVIGEVIARIRSQLQDQQTRALNRMRADFGERLGQIVGRLDVLAPQVAALSRELEQRSAIMDARDFELQAAIRTFREAIDKTNRLSKELFYPKP